MQYYILLRGHAKDRLKPIMIDELKKVKNYMQERLVSDKTGNKKTWHYDIQPAGKDDKPWKVSASGGEWKNRNSSNPPLVRNRSRS